MTDDIALLGRLGTALEGKIAEAGLKRTGFFETTTIRDFLISSLLRVRSEACGVVRLHPNRAQQEFSRVCTHRTADLDAGVSAPAGGGFEVRWSDAGWGQYNDKNLAGRFTTQTFTLPRLAKVQNYFLRQFDASTPPKYSRFSAALHIDYPF